MLSKMNHQMLLILLELYGNHKSVEDLQADSVRRDMDGNRLMCPQVT
jgi:hypothetical protein